jgi:hypothetical protein
MANRPKSGDPILAIPASRTGSRDSQEDQKLRKERGDSGSNPQNSSLVSDLLIF